MAQLPGTIDRGKLRLVYAEERERSSNDSDGFCGSNARSFVSTKSSLS
jgi:hypothetical protein